MGKELNLLDIIIVLAKYKKTVILNFIAISIAALTYALLITKYYKSEVVFIPKGRSGSGLFSMIGDNFSADIIGGSSLSKRQYKALLYSRELREKLIKKFNLIEVYEHTELPNPIDKTLKVLQENINIEEEQEGGLGITDVISITITVIDKDPARASEMANYLFFLLDEKSTELNQFEYTQITDFLSEKITLCNENLNSARKELNAYQRANHLYNIPEQTSMVLQAFSITRAEILSLENKIAYLKSIHSSDYKGIGVLKQKISSLEKKMIEMEQSKKNELFLGLDRSLDLTNRYVDLVTEVEAYTQLRILLKQQFEQAKIKQSKEFSPLFLIDKARPAEYKFKPKRAVVILVIVFIYMSMIISLLLLWNHYNDLRINDPERIKKIDILLQTLIKRKSK